MTGLWTRALAPGVIAVGCLAFSAVANAQDSCTFTVTGSMLESRFGHTATTLKDGRVLITGGLNTFISPCCPLPYLASAELYDPATGTFGSTGSMTTPRVYHAATLLPDGRVLITGGGNFTKYEFTAQASAELYDPTTGTFSPVGQMMTPREYHTATLLANGTVLIATGVDDAFDYLNSAELYDSATGVFTATGHVARARWAHTATLLGSGQVLIAGGADASGSLDSAELYDPGTGTFSSAGPMTTSRRGHTATLLRGGQVLIGGGFTWTPVGCGDVDLCSSTSVLLASAELYDPATGTFFPTASLGTARTGHAAALLPKGTVLVAGGDNGFYSYPPASLASAELYDPVTGTFSPASDMTTGRSLSTAVPLANGQVLIAGGLNSSGPLAGAELYTSACGGAGAVAH